jgi:uncharacterized repeat protein (TIGR01451 family)
MRTQALTGARTFILTGFIALLAVTTARAQTPEGTTIRNIASATFTDANSNSYAAVADTVDITVGFVAGLSVTPDGGSQAPSSPQGATTMAFTITNIGNGTDQVQLSEVITDASSVFDSIGYNYNSTDYQTLAALNTALASVDITQGSNITVNVVYKIASGKGGLSANYELTATSNRDGGISDPGDYDINVGETVGVAVTPDGGQNLTHLPSNGTDYTFTFNVENTGDGPETYDLRALFVDVADIAIVSVNGVAGDSTQITLNAGANQNIDVVYTVLDRPAGTQDTVYLRARSLTGPGTAADSGFADLTIIRPALAILKQAYTDAALTTQVSGNVLPGDTIWYKITVSNSSTNSANATSIDVDDDLPTQVAYDTHGDDSSGWTIAKVDGPPEHIDAQLASLAPGASAYFWVRVIIQ